MSHKWRSGTQMWSSTDCQHCLLDTSPHTMARPTCVNPRVSIYLRAGLPLGASTGAWLCRYIHTFESGFDEGLRDLKLSFMQSDGGLTPVSRFSGHKAILSGPAGG